MTNTHEAVRLADELIRNGYEESGDNPDSLLWQLANLSEQQAAILRHVPELESEVQEQARLNGMGAERELALRARIEELEAERDKLRAELEGRWLPIGFLWRHKDEPDSQYRFCSDLKQAEDAHLLMHTDVILVCPAKSTPPATQGIEA